MKQQGEQAAWTYRLRDLAIASAGLLLCSLPMLLLVLLLWISQRRIFFAQQRPGLHERPFYLLKFSTLRDPKPGEPEKENQQARLTPMGRWLRRWSLDELPQLINVMRGDMSLVGPRPLLMEYLPLYSPEARRRHSVKPGITGWAQVRGRNRLSFKERFALDLWYIDHRSHALDAYILWLTLWKVLRREGVYADDNTTSPAFDGSN